MSISKEDCTRTIKFYILNGYTKRYPHSDAQQFVDDIFDELTRIGCLNMIETYMIFMEDDEDA